MGVATKVAKIAPAHETWCRKNFDLGNMGTSLLPEQGISTSRKNAILSYDTGGCSLLFPVARRPHQTCLNCLTESPCCRICRAGDSSGGERSESPRIRPNAPTVQSVQPVSILLLPLMICSASASPIVAECLNPWP